MTPSAKTFAIASALLIAAPATEAAPETLISLMVDVVNPAANTLWRAGMKDTMSDKDWDEVKRAVAALSAASVTVAAHGTMPGDNGFAQLPTWREWSAKFTATVQASKGASDRKDLKSLVMVSDTLVAVCEGCHMAVAANP